MKVYEAIAEAFLAEGTDTVFTVMGDATMHCLVTLDERGVRVISARHESGAVAMADGYARATREVGVASTTCGPGLTQIGTQLMVASRARTPLVVFVGDTPGRADVHPQDMDQRRFVEACEAGFQPVRSADTAPADTRAAFERARRERRPIVLNAPKDIQFETYPWDWSYTPSVDISPRAQRVSAPRTFIEEAADMVGAARRPVIIAGIGAVQSEARESILELARMSGALVATTLVAKGWLDDDPFCVGVSGAFSSAVAEELFTEADLVIAVGSSLDYFTTEGGLLYPNARYLWINLEASPRTGGRPDDAFVQGDADTVTRSIVDILSARGHSSAGFRTDDVARRFLPYSGTDDGAGGGVEPRESVRIIDRYLDDKNLVVVGCGHFWSFPIQHMHGPRGGFLFTHHFGSIGQCLSTAIGAAVGRPDRRIVAFEGDASLMMHLQELETAARNNIPLLVVVLNDEALGAELHQLYAEGVANTVGSAIPTPRLADVAIALGCRGATAYNEEEVESAMREHAAAPDGPFLLDIRISRSMSEPYQKLKLGMVNTAPHQGKSFSGDLASAERS